MAWARKWCLRCEGREGMIHASDLCCVRPDVRSRALRGTGEVAEGVLHGAERGSSCWNEKGGERAREMKRCAVPGLEGYAFA